MGSQLGKCEGSENTPKLFFLSSIGQVGAFVRYLQKTLVLLLKKQWQIHVFLMNSEVISVINLI